MKRMFLFGALLLAFAGLCTFNSVYLQNCSKKAAETVISAQNAIKSGDSEAATTIFNEVRREWDSKAGYLSVIVRHDILDMTRVSFARASENLSAGETVNFLEETSALSEMLISLADSDTLNIKNIF